MEIQIGILDLAGIKLTDMSASNKHHNQNPEYATELRNTNKKLLQDNFTKPIEHKKEDVFKMLGWKAQKMQEMKKKLAINKRF